MAWIIRRLPEDELPTVTVPTEAEQELRLLVAEQVALVQSRTSEINRLHAWFAQDGVTTVSKKDLKSPENRQRRFTVLAHQTGLQSQGLGQETFADSCRTGDDENLSFANPSAIRQASNSTSVQ